MTATPTATTHRRVLDAALDVTTAQGWAAVTMAEVASRAGVSRQTVYNEVGSRQRLAEALVLDQLGRFLAVVDDAFDRHPDHLGRAVRAAVLAVLDLAETDPLLRVVVSPAGGGELLPPLTTDSGALLEAATRAVDGRLDAYGLTLDRRSRAAAVDMIVRTVLSHVMQPSQRPARTADDVASLALRLLA